MYASMTGRPMRRRSALAALGAAVLAAALPVAGGIGQRESPAAILASPRAARRIGRRYLAIAPGEADPVRLAATLPALRDPVAQRRALDAARRRDFAAGDTVILDGWILARSEARLCALAALTV